MEKDYIERSERTREDHGRDRSTSKGYGEVEVHSVGPTRHIGVKGDDHCSGEWCIVGEFLVYKCLFFFSCY